MEAVIDVHAFANGRAFVEVVIENGRILPSDTITPATQTYTAATVSVNGSAINGSGTNSSHTYDVAQDHKAFTAWYCSGWVNGDPLIEVTQDTASMQAHPLLYRIEKASTVNLSATYGTDAYVPWNGARNRAQQAGTGDHDSIGPLPIWEAHYLQSGDKNARKAVLASGTALLHSNVQYRNTSTNLPLTPAEVAGKTVAGGSFPRQGFPFADYTADYHWDYAHQPATGLLPFLCRPSPCFIELAQRVATYNALGNNTGDGLLGEFFETRGRAWGWRNIAHACFLTPDSQSAMKSAIQANMAANASYLLQWAQSPYNKLGIVWDWTPTNVRDIGGTGTQDSTWQHTFLAPELFKAYQSKLITGAGQSNLSTLATWAVSFAVRWVNEQTDGRWRYIGYHTVIGTREGAGPSSTLGQFDTWGEMRAWLTPISPPSISGAWYTTGGDDAPYVGGGWTQEDGAGGYQYVDPFWSTLVAAVEFGVSGAEAAWATVQSNVTNLTAFRDSAGTDPRHICYPRNK
jgi:hypothetical protein